MAWVIGTWLVPQHNLWMYPLVNVCIEIEAMTIEIVDLPIRIVIFHSKLLLYRRVITCFHKDLLLMAHVLFDDCQILMVI